MVDKFDFNAALEDCKLVRDGIKSEEDFQNADSGLVLYYLNTIVRALEIAATVKQGKWISCSERLPNNAERCIVFMSDGNIQFGWWNAQHYEGGNDGGVWCVLYPGKPAKLFRIKNVPYWMPLPNPPGGDDNG